MCRMKLRGKFWSRRPGQKVFVPYGSAKRPEVGELLSSDFPIDTGHGISLNLLRPDEQDRLIRLFKEVWHTIPDTDRRLIAAFWLGVRFSNHPRVPAPRIVASDHVANGGAAVAEEGYHLIFSVRHIRAMSDHILKAAIAHELAHVLQHAEGATWGPHTRQEIEDDAEAKTFEWGFNSDELQNWVDTFALTGKPPV